MELVEISKERAFNYYDVVRNQDEMNDFSFSPKDFDLGEGPKARGSSGPKPPGYKNPLIEEARMEREAYAAKQKANKGAPPKPKLKVNDVPMPDPSPPASKVRGLKRLRRMPKKVAIPVAVAGTALTGAGAVANRDKVKKMEGPFGVEISKAMSREEKKTAKNPKYRKSYLAPLNPRSNTYVKEGTMGRRVARPVAGNVAGSLVGAAAGSLVKRPDLGSNVGSIVGGSLGATRNLKTGNTISYNKRSGKKAKEKVMLGSAMVNTY